MTPATIESYHGVRPGARFSRKPEAFWFSWRQSHCQARDKPETTEEIGWLAVARPRLNGSGEYSWGDGGRSLV